MKNDYKLMVEALEKVFQLDEITNGEMRKHAEENPDKYKTHYEVRHHDGVTHKIISRHTSLQDAKNEKHSKNHIISTIHVQNGSGKRILGKQY